MRKVRADRDPAVILFKQWLKLFKRHKFNLWLYLNVTGNHGKL